MLTTTGARSGLVRTLPVLGLPDGDGMILIASNFGRPHNPSWYHNLRANPQATIAVGGVSRAVVARELDGPSESAGTGAARRSIPASRTIAAGRPVAAFRCSGSSRASSRSATAADAPPPSARLVAARHQRGAR
jgi:deazaflavin-dependent oxidoreductase (nitroreductase family)